MVTARLLSTGLLILFSMHARALLPQTAEDLRVAEDRLQYEFGELKAGSRVVTPILVATPQAHWAESRADFAASANAMLTRAFPRPGDLIACAECFSNRVFVTNDGRTVAQSGELSLSDLARLRAQPGFAAAKTLLIIRETPSGIELRLSSIDDGRILYVGLADATVNLSHAEPPLRLARELDRRKRGEALSYVHIDLGVYPNGLGQLKWLEQWGDRNQHMSGLAIGVFNPTGALGASYLYMMPFNRRVTVGATVYYALQGLFTAGGSDGVAAGLSAQGQVGYAITGAYGVFVSGDTKGVITAGFSLLNPVLLPFLL